MAEKSKAEKIIAGLVKQTQADMADMNLSHNEACSVALGALAAIAAQLTNPVKSTRESAKKQLREWVRLGSSDESNG